MDSSIGLSPSCRWVPGFRFSLAGLGLTRFPSDCHAPRMNTRTQPKEVRLQPASQFYWSALFLPNSSIVKPWLTTANPLWAALSAARSMRTTRAFPLSRTVGVGP